ncbi:MAG: hypothetical protein EXR12_10230 [Rhodospirillaceae bacterium]|nr:hypothetical protein [Rhodospirillaceae bacterium]
MTAPQVHVFFQEYVEAFVEPDIDRICSMWGYPAFMAFGGRQLVFDSASFRTNVIRLCQFYATQGMARAEKDVVDLVQLTATTAAVRTVDRLYKANGTILAKWQHAYLLSETSRKISIVAALPDDENRAWRELGAY